MHYLTGRHTACALFLFLLVLGQNSGCRGFGIVAASAGAAGGLVSLFAHLLL